MNVLIIVLILVGVFSVIVYKPRIEFQFNKTRLKEAKNALLAATGIIVLTILWVIFADCPIPLRFLFVAGLVYLMNVFFNNAVWAFSAKQYYISIATADPRKIEGLRGFLFFKNVILAKENGKPVEWVMDSALFETIEQAREHLYIAARSIADRQEKDSSIVWIEDEYFMFNKENWLKYGTGWFEGPGLYNLNAKEIIFKKGNDSFSCNGYTYSIKSS